MRAVAIAAVLVALLATACGDDDADVAADGTASSPPPTTPTTTERNEAPVVLEADVPSQVEAGPVTWSFDVVNTTDQAVTLTFTSGQEGDARLIAGDGQVVHTWSAARSFIQMIEERPLGPGERFTVTLDDDLGDVAPGTYTLELTLTVQDPPPAVGRDIEVVAA